MAHRPPRHPSYHSPHPLFNLQHLPPPHLSLPPTPPSSLINYPPSKKKQRTKSQANMAAAASPAINSSCFSTTATRQLRSKPVHFRPTTTMPTVSNVAEQLSLTAVVSRRRLLKITAAVAQEEVAQEEVAQEDSAAAAEEEGEGEGEGEGVEEVAEPVIVQNTKLYFGNLPYNCDSAQLAGIIQEYASPEMVEVRLKYRS